MDEAFEKWWSQHWPENEPGGHVLGLSQAAWDAALAEMHKSQTAETCNANPPHPKSCEGKIAHIVGESYCGSYLGCLVCEAQEAGRREGLMEAAKTLCGRCKDGIELVRQGKNYAHVSRLAGDTDEGLEDAVLVNPHYEKCAAVGIHRLLEGKGK